MEQSPHWELLLQNKNRSFALAIEGLGLAGLFLTLFFAYYNQLLPSLYLASLCFAVIMALTLSLSLKQQKRGIGIDGSPYRIYCAIYVACAKCNGGGTDGLLFSD